MIRAGTICTTLLYNYLLSDTTIDDENDTGKKLIKKSNKLQCLSDTFQSYGGVLAKLSQMLCFDNQDNKVFSDCKPYSTEKTVQYLKDQFSKNPEFFSDIKTIDFNVFKSGSFGQVHKAVHKDGREIVMKVLYVGLADQIKSDLYILDKVTYYLFNFADLDNAMVDIKTKLYEELDYKVEISNQKLIYDLWEDHPDINIPEVLPELSTKNILTMKYVKADSLSYFFDHSTQDQRNKIGMLLVEFVFTNIYKYNTFYPDTHYGNFLVDKDTKLYVMDFGCLNMISETMIDNLTNLHMSLLEENKDRFYSTVEKMGLLDEKSISAESKDYMYDYFKIQATPWLTDDFEFNQEWLDFAVYKNTELMKEWKIPSDIVWYNKIPYGLFHILTKLTARGNFKSIFDKLLG